MLRVGPKFEIRDISCDVYACRDDSAVYHLVDPATEETVCGLKVRRLHLKKKSGLTNTPTRPLDKVICKHCVKLSAPPHLFLLSPRV
jgi:hypothetical protein